MVMRHSKQIPIPHSGPRGAPVTEVRQACRARTAAAAAVVPGGTSTATPLTLSRSRLGMDVLLSGSGRKIRLQRNLRLLAGQLIGQKVRSAQRSCDAEALVTRGQPNGGIAGPGTDQRQFIGGRGAEACPGADDRHL